MRRRISESKPVIWLYDGTYYLFVEEGVYELPPDFRRAIFRGIVWTLVDSDESTEGVPPSLVGHGTRLFVVYATSPARQRWSRLEKTTLTTTLIMNPWTRSEILRV